MYSRPKKWSNLFRCKKKLRDSVRFKTNVSYDPNRHRFNLCENIDLVVHIDTMYAKKASFMHVESLI